MILPNDIVTHVGDKEVATVSDLTRAADAAEPTQVGVDGGIFTEVSTCQYFTVTELKADGTVTVGKPDTFTAVLVLEGECTAKRLMEEITALLQDKTRYNSMRKTLQELVVPDSAERLCAIMENLIDHKS